ncbi:MAG: hypothetical protein QOE90_1901 [Thermoplasmata archaeon]|jgi:hypothetical protein|nr:hypothetical protein [Thermoplasmata archaeon]
MKVAPLALALLLLLPFAPLARADAPQAEPWTPYNALAQTHALAFARQGTTIAVALDAYSFVSTGCTLVCPPTNPTQPPTTVPDLSILQSDVGWVHNGTGNLAVQGNTQPLGRTLVAVTPDGHSVASVGLDRTTQTSAPSTPDPMNPQPPTPNPQEPRTLKLYVDEAPLGGNFSAGPIQSAALEIPGVAATGLAISDDGSRVAVLVDAGNGNFTLEAYGYAAGTATHVFSTTFAGAPGALAADGAMSRLLVGGDFALPGNRTSAGLALVSYRDGQPFGARYVEPANGTRLATMAATPDGRLVALGTTTGRLVVLDGATATYQGAYQAGAGSDNVSQLAISTDGSRLALVAGGKLDTFALGATGAPAPAWSASAPGRVQSLSYNGTGAILVASVTNSSADGAYAYGPDAAGPIWVLPASSFTGPIEDARLNDAGTRMAYREGHTVWSTTLARGFLLHHPTGGKTGPVRPLRAGASTVFDMVVEANGSAPETVSLSVSPDPFLTASIDAPVVTVSPGTPRHVNVTLSSTPQFTGTHGVSLVATGLSGSDAATLSVSFEGVANVTFAVNQTEYLVTPGQPTDAVITVVNNGTSDAAVGLRYTQTVSGSAGWGLSVDQTSFRLPQGSITPIRVVVTPPPSTPNGTSDTVTFNLEGPNVSDTVVLHFRVNPHLGVHVTAAGSVKYVAPSQAAVFNVTITNNGSISRPYLVLADQTATNGFVWAVDFLHDAFRLEPGQSRTLQVTVRAPGGVTPADHAAILLRARTVPEAPNETVAEDNITLFAQAVAPPTPTPSTPAHGVPGPQVPLSLALILVLALARRRRSP